jgi:hypothetical protein
VIKKVLAVVVVLAFAVGSAAMVAPLFFLRPEAGRARAVPAHAPVPPQTAPKTGVEAAARARR